MVLLVLEFLESRQIIVAEQIRVSDMIDDILAQHVNRTSQLCLDEAEVVIDCLLKNPALGLDWLLNCKFS